MCFFLIFIEKAAKEKALNNHTDQHSNEEEETPEHSSIDPATLFKARSLSIDTIKSSFEKKIKDRNLSLSTEPLNTEQTAAGGNESQKIKKKTKSTENSLSGLLTFDHVPSAPKKEDLSGVAHQRKISPRKNFSDKESKVHKVTVFIVMGFYDSHSCSMGDKASFSPSFK